MSKRQIEILRIVVSLCFGLALSEVILAGHVFVSIILMAAWMAFNWLTVEACYADFHEIVSEARARALGIRPKDTP